MLPPRFLRNKNGFTLIELLVVVLIIGVLAAIAFPQYQYVVLKSRYYSFFPQVKAAQDAVQRHILATGQRPNSQSELDLDFGPGITFAISSSRHTLQIISQLGDYPKTGVWLTSREANEFKIACESFVSDKNGMRLCKEFFPREITCPPEVYQGNGTIKCFLL